MAKTRSSISIDADLLEDFKRYGISTSEFIEKYGREAVKKAKAEKWKEENKEALAEYKNRIERDGTFADRHGVWNGK